jgi:uncharacterized OsmC-like protein
MSIQAEVVSESAVSTAKIENPLGATVRAIQGALTEAGPRGRVQFAAQTRLVQGLETAANIRGFNLVIDEPPSLGGADLGPNPVEVVLAALGACQEIVYATYASILNVQIDKLEINVVGDLDPRGFYNVAEVPAGFERVEYHVNLVSPSPAARVRELIDTVNSHCPVLDILQRPLPVYSQYVVNGQPVVQ